MQRKEKNNIFKITIIFFILIMLLIFFYVLVKNTNSNKDIEDENSYISYDDFIKEYDEYNWEDYDISEDNYYSYEDEFFSRKYSKMIECEIIKVNKDAFLIINNNSDEYLGTIRTTIIFYDENNQIIDIANVYSNELEYGGKRIALIYKFPLAYARVDFFNEVDKPDKIPELRASNIQCELITDEKSKYAKITNNNTERCESVNGIILFFDELGNAISYSNVYVSGGIESNESKMENLYNCPASFDSYEFIINSIR